MSAKPPRRPQRHWPLAMAVAAAVAALPPSAGYADYAPVDDIRDLMLVYAGEERWSAEDFRPYVAYLGGPDGNRPQDWFYDSFLVLQYGGAPSGAPYINGQTTKADWEHFRRLIFEPQSHLHALDAAIGEAAAVLGEPPRRLSSS